MPSPVLVAFTGCSTTGFSAYESVLSQGQEKPLATGCGAFRCMCIRFNYHHGQELDRFGARNSCYLVQYSGEPMGLTGVVRLISCTAVRGQFIRSMKTEHLATPARLCPKNGPIVSMLQYTHTHFFSCTGCTIAERWVFRMITMKKPCETPIRRVPSAFCVDRSSVVAIVYSNLCSHFVPCANCSCWPPMPGVSCFLL